MNLLDLPDKNEICYRGNQISSQTQIHFFGRPKFASNLATGKLHS